MWLNIHNYLIILDLKTIAMTTKPCGRDFLNKYEILKVDKTDAEPAFIIIDGWRWFGIIKKNTYSIPLF